MNSPVPFVDAAVIVVDNSVEKLDIYIRYNIFIFNEIRSKWETATSIEIILPLKRILNDL